MSSAHRLAVVKAEALANAAIVEACNIALEEGGTDEMLQLLAILVHGKILPSAIVLRLQRQAAQIAETNVAKFA